VGEAQAKSRGIEMRRKKGDKGSRKKRGKIRKEGVPKIPHAFQVRSKRKKGIRGMTEVRGKKEEIRGSKRRTPGGGRYGVSRRNKYFVFQGKKGCREDAAKQARTSSRRRLTKWREAGEGKRGRGSGNH